MFSRVMYSQTSNGDDYFQEDDFDHVSTDDIGVEMGCCDVGRLGE
jgi:hypothetical protein